MIACYWHVDDSHKSKIKGHDIYMEITQRQRTRNDKLHVEVPKLPVEVDQTKSQDHAS